MEVKAGRFLCAHICAMDPKGNNAHICATDPKELTDLYGRNGKAAKAESESINDRPKRSMINDRTPRENYGRLSQTASKVYWLHASILRVPSHQLHKARRSAATGYAINDRTCVFVHNSGYTELFRARYILWLAAHLVQCSDGMFSRFRYFFITPIK